MAQQNTKYRKKNNIGSQWSLYILFIVSSNFSLRTLIIKVEIKKKKNKFESVLMRWMKLEPIIQSEVSQKEKHQYSILTHIYGI